MQTRPDDTTDLIDPRGLPARAIAAGLAALLGLALLVVAASLAAPGRLSIAAAAPGLALLLAAAAAGWRAERTTRRELLPARRIVSALAEFHAGERRRNALRIEPSDRPPASAWNALLDELDRLDQARTAERAEAACLRFNGGSAGAGRILSGLHIGVLLIDQFGAVSEANPAACIALGHQQHDLLGTPAANAFNDRACAEAIAEVGSGRAPVANVTLEAEGGTVYAVMLRGLGRGAGDREVVAAIEDVTQRRRSERTRGQFVANTAHELRAPLTNIRLYVEEAIEAGVSSPDVVAASLNVVQTEARRLGRLVDDMLSVAEIESGAISIHRRETKLNTLFAELEQDFAAMADSKGVELAFDLPPKFPQAWLDRERISLALQNLVGNAVKYTDLGGRVDVAVHADDAALEIAVRDTGIGIAPEEQDKIFDRFVRSADERVVSRVGTGLGLCIAREIARQHGGDITLESELGRGSTFTLTVPIAAEIRQAA